MGIASARQSRRGSIALACPAPIGQQQIAASATIRTRARALSNRVARQRQLCLPLLAARVRRVSAATAYAQGVIDVQWHVGVELDVRSWLCILTQLELTCPAASVRGVGRAAAEREQLHLIACDIRSECRDAARSSAVIVAGRDPSAQ